MRQSNSETIIPQTDEFTQVGTPLGGTGAGPITAKLAAAGVKLATVEDPDNFTMQNLVSLIQACKSLRGRKSPAIWKSGSDGHSYQDFEIIIPLTCDDQDALDQLHKDLPAFLAPAPDEKIIEWITELAAITPPRQGSEVNNAVAFKAYLNRLREYPADIARFALHRQTYEWFPSWAELEANMRPMMRVRQKLIDAVPIYATSNGRFE